MQVGAGVVHDTPEAGQQVSMSFRRASAPILGPGKRRKSVGNGSPHPHESGSLSLPCLCHPHRCFTNIL